MSTFRRYLNNKLQDTKFAREYEEISDAVNLGIALAERREELGLTQQELAERTGIKQPMLARLERGQLPTMPTLRRIAKALDARVVIDDEQIIVEPKSMATIAVKAYVNQWENIVEETAIPHIALPHVEAAGAASTWYSDVPTPMIVN